MALAGRGEPPRWLGWPRRSWRQLALWALLLIALRLVVIPAEARAPLSVEQLRASVSAASGWMQRAQFENGRYLYRYDAERDVAPNEYNEVRHAGVTMALFQAAGREGDLAALAAADRAVEWMTEHLHRRGGWAALTNAGGTRAKVGATALMTVALAERRLATADPRHDALLRDLGAFLARMQRPDGGFHVAWQVREGAPDLAGTSIFYPGEALWALALLHEAFPGEGWDARARAASIFITTRRDEVEDIRFRPLPDHWASYGLAEMAEWGLSDAEIDYARRLAGRFGFLIRVESQREQGLFDGIGRLIRVDVPAAAFGTWIEGLSALWRLSAADPRMADLRPQIEARLAIGASLLARRQIDVLEAGDYANPERVLGAWLTNGETRMDDQQHALSGLLFASDALEGRTNRSPESLLQVAGP